MANFLKTRFIQFIRDEEGASAIEYALIAAMVAVVLVLFVTPVGTQVKSIFNQILVALGGTAV